MIYPERMAHFVGDIVKEFSRNLNVFPGNPFGWHIFHKLDIGGNGRMQNFANFA
jgi:hypothetical protein